MYYIKDRDRYCVWRMGWPNDRFEILEAEAFERLKTMAAEMPDLIGPLVEYIK